jgi:acylphosphatase
LRGREATDAIRLRGIFMKTIHLIVSGRVQGVYFRQTTCEKATTLQVTGRVRNMADGTVEIRATGEEKNLEQLIRWCHQGPPRAVVNKVSVTDAPLENFASFEIQRF